MKKRTIRRTTAALAVLALLAGHAMTGGTVAAQTQSSPSSFWQTMCTPGFNTGCTAQNPVTECKAAWEASPAYATCQFATFEADTQSCTVTTACQFVDDQSGNTHYRSDSWQGSLEEIGSLHNCDGNLSLGC